jgi:outer membrane protein assembly factor BamB
VTRASRRRSSAARRYIAVLRGSLAGAALCGGVGLVGCTSDGVNPEVPLWFHHKSGAIDVVIEHPLTATSRTTGEDYERSRAAIDPDNGRVFIGSADHGLYALHAGDGTPIWRFETLGVVQSEPLYDPDLDIVYFGSHDGALYAVKARDGALVFRFMTGAEVSRKPVIGGETLYVANGADQLYAIDRRTGKPKWNVRRTPALGMEIAGYAGPLLDQGKVYLAFSDGHVDAYDAKDGTERWTPVDLSAEAEQSSNLGEAPRYLDVDTTPVLGEIAGERVIYVASYAGGVFALDSETGARVWVNDQAIGATDLTLWEEPAHMPNTFGPDKGGPKEPARELLFASSAVSGLWALDPANGQRVWRIKIPDGGMTAPAAINGALLLGTTDYGLFLLSPRNGKVIDAVDLGSGFAQTPSVYGAHAYLMSNAGTFLGVTVTPPVSGYPTHG